MEQVNSQVLYAVIILYSIITGLYLSRYQINCIKKEHPTKFGKRLMLVSLPLLLVLARISTRMFVFSICPVLSHFTQQMKKLDG